MRHFLACAHSCHLHGWTDAVVGYIASTLVLAAFTMTSMRSQRTTAIASNLACMSCAVAADMRRILILHSILLPVNVVRLMQIGRGRNRTAGADAWI